MSTLVETVKSIRSKNAGPFWLTIDAFCHCSEDVDKVANAFDREKDYIARIFKVSKKNIKIFRLPLIRVVKVSFPRVPIEGALGERDMHGGQQYVSLLDIEV